MRQTQVDFCPLREHLFDWTCVTVQGLLDWYEVDLGFTKFHFFRLMRVLCAFLSPMLSSRSPLSFFDVVHCLHHVVGVPLQSAYNFVSRMGPCGARAIHFDVLGLKITCSVFKMIELMIRVFIEVRFTFSSQHNQLLAVLINLFWSSQLLHPPQGQRWDGFASANATSSRLSGSWLTWNKNHW